MSSPDELKDCLRQTVSYAEGLIQNTFTADRPDWETHNRWTLRTGGKNVLPYKLLFLFEMPEGLDEESFALLKRLLRHCRRCGIFVFFTFDGTLLNCGDSSRAMFDQTDDMLRYLTDNSLSFDCLSLQSFAAARLSHVEILEELGDVQLQNRVCLRLAEEYGSALKGLKKKGTSFGDLTDIGSIFDKDSKDGLQIPLGFKTTNRETLMIELGDETPHYLIGGATGSGKSNLLHVLILSACLRYGPEQLRLYLMDFKDGVEFAAYAEPPLPHAQLVACCADADYGLSVLEHLVNEKKRRYELFKKHGVKDLRGYCQKIPGAVLPRIVLIVDEFQELFQEAVIRKTKLLMKDLAKQGRACGIHVVLATQSLRGVDFSDVDSQFGGRIALRCDPEDSGSFLGGGSYAPNMAAAALDRHYAIVNTAQGAVEKNITFSVPYAEPFLDQTLKQLAQACGDSKAVPPTKIYRGNMAPPLPKREAFVHSGTPRFLVGNVESYESESLAICVERRRDNNLLVCCPGRNVAQSFRCSLLLSADGAEQIDEIVYIGRDALPPVDTPVRTCQSAEDFFRQSVEELIARRRLVILDGCDLKEQLHMSDSFFPQESEGSIVFEEYMKRANEAGSFVAAIYDSAALVRKSGLPKDAFRFRIASGLNGSDLSALLSDSTKLYADQKEGTALYVRDGIAQCTFKPYAALG